MIKKNAIRLAAAAGIAGLFATMAPLSAFAATKPTWDTTSDGPVYLMNNTTAAQFGDNDQLDWNQSSGVVLTAAPVPTDLSDLGPLTFPAPTGGALDYMAFVAPVGSERTKSAWKQWGDSVQLNGAGALLPAVWPGYLGNGTPAAVKAAGGTYSMGIAYLKNNDLTVVSAYYTTINVDAGAGTWKFATPTAVVNKADTTTALAASATSVYAGAKVTLTATVSPSAATGNVTFKDGSATLGTSATSGGVATYSVSTLAKGDHTITADYTGDDAYNASTSASVKVTVSDTPAPDESALTDSNKGGISVAVAGTTATITVPAALNGKSVNVWGYSSPSFLGQGTISGGQIVVDASALAAGSHKIAIVEVSTGDILGWADVTITEQGGKATRHLKASVAWSTDGDFKLLAPDDSTPALINNPKLDSDGQSVSTGTLGAFSVVDNRYVAQKGWDLTTSVDPFTNGSDTIANSALGLKPVESTNEGPGTPTLGSEQVAGSATYPSSFASLASGSYSGQTDLNADLTFKAPKGTKAGDYTSLLTLTLVSK
jgi:hypothetical protein